MKTHAQSTSKALLSLMVLTLLVWMSATQTASAQAILDRRIVGSYQAVMGPSTIPSQVIRQSGVTSTNEVDDINFNGALFRFDLLYDFLGYHRGRVSGSRGVAFVDGRAYKLSGSMLVLPVSVPGSGTSALSGAGTVDAKNRDLLFNFDSIALPVFADKNLELFLEGRARYVDRKQGSLMRGSVTYQSADGDTSARVEFDAVSVFSDSRIRSEVLGNPPPDFEAKKLGPVGAIGGTVNNRTYR